jgi:predicted alpha/beta-fold hydrolase
MDLVQDFKEALEYIQARYPDYKIYSIGFSYGANRLINVLIKFI